jgi:hypothetical protein
LETPRRLKEHVSSLGWFWNLRKGHLIQDNCREGFWRKRYSRSCRYLLCSRAVHRRRVAPSPSRCQRAVHRRRVTVEPSIAEPSRHPSPSRPLPSHPSPSPSRFHRRPVAVMTSIAIACRQAVHRQAIAPFIAEPSIAEPFIAVAVKLSIAVGSLHWRCIAVKPFIAKSSRRPSPSRPLPSRPSPSRPSPSHPSPSPSCVHRCRRCAFIAVTSPS